MFQLKSLLKCPPGSFYFEETVNGVTHKFASTPLPEQLAYEIKERRKGNNLPRATFEEALADIIVFTCTRLNNDSSFCYETDKTVAQLHGATVKSGCRGCGVRL